MALALAAALGLFGNGAARAHDTWLEPRPDTERGERVLALGTGEQFPALQSPVPVELLQGSRCAARGVSPVAAPPAWPLRWRADGAHALLLRTTRPVPPALLLDCPVPMASVPITLDAAAAAAYLDEVRADAATRERWRALQARGVAWNERFSKQARLLHGGGVLPGPLVAGATRGAEAMAFDARLELPRWPLRVGDVLQLQLLRDGQPLAGHAVELRNDQSPIGLWRRTDAEGRVAMPLPLAARWLLRSVDLRPAADVADAWESRFLSVGLDVQAPR